MGPSWYRPANISATLGITWVSIGAYSVTAPLTALLRQLVPSSTFTTTAFAVPPGAPAAAYMGTYAPIVVVCSRAQFQLNYCASPSHATSGSRQDRLRIDGVMRKPIGPLWPRRATDTRHVATHMGGVPRLR